MTDRPPRQLKVKERNIQLLGPVHTGIAQKHTAFPRNSCTVPCGAILQPIRLNMLQITLKCRKCSTYTWYCNAMQFGAHKRTAL